MELRVVDDADAASRAVAELLAEAAARGGHVALAGGSTPRTAYTRSTLHRSDWHAVELWWGDERCVPAGDVRSNYRVVREALLDGLSRPPEAVHRVRTELGCEAAAAAYDEALGGVGFSFVLLGLGADGHTASLFPNAPALEEQTRRAVAVSATDVERVTLTPPVFAEAETLVYLAVGAEKAEAAARAFAGEPDPATPASLVRGRTTIVVLDASAARLLGNPGG